MPTEQNVAANEIPGEGEINEDPGQGEINEDPGQGEDINQVRNYPIKRLYI